MGLCRYITRHISPDHIHGARETTAPNVHSTTTMAEATAVSYHIVIPNQN